MSKNPGIKKMLLGGFLAGSIFVASAFGQTAPANPSPAAAPVKARVHHVSPYRGASSSNHARDYYQRNWGVDHFSAKIIEAGQLVRFSYRVIDAKKALVLHDKKNSPLLLDPRAHVQLVIPSLEKVGQLRQSSNPEAGHIYWMAFSNKGKVVKPGDRVSVVIGGFRVDELTVE